MPTKGDDENRIPPEREGQYSRLGELGRGAQSVVVLARDRFIGREIALKELLPDPTQAAIPRTGSSPAEARFLREARLIAQLDHPGIVAIHELAQRADGTLFYAEKLIRGETLKAHLQSCSSLRERLALLPHLIDACNAIAYAHSRGVIHRDLKPSNIMVGPYGETVVVDWGLAKQWGELEMLDSVPADAIRPEPDLTLAGVALGTPSYMSPEQARGAVEEIDERSDVFSLGSMLYELLCGRVPFEGSSGEEIIGKVLSASIIPARTLTPDVPPELAAIAERALQRDPKDRYESAEALAKDLRAYQAGDRVRAYEYRSWELVRKFVAANRGLSAATVAAVVILVVAAAIILHQLQVARVNLAQSFIERAKTAESVSDWARAAGYYAASRIEHDSAEARWGYALAAERVSPRVSVRRGLPGAFVDVGPLADGRLITLGHRNGVLIGSDLATAKELWRAELPEGAQNISLRPRQLVSMLSPSPRNPLLTLTGRTLLDAATGKFLASFDLDEGAPCSRSPFPPPVLVSSAGLVTAPVEGGQPTVLSATVYRQSACIVSDDGREVAFDDARGSIHIWNLVDRKELAVRYAPDVREMIFTTHGLALVRPTVIHVFGGPEGDFLVDVPRGSGTSLRTRAGGVAVSGDGHRVVLDRGSGHHADLVDLQLRTVVSSFSFVPGQPRLAFSRDGKQVFAAGLQGDSALSSWEIRAPVPRKSFEGSPSMGVQPSRDGKRFLIFLKGSPSRWELYDAAGTRLLSGTFGQNPAYALTPDGRRIVTRDDDGVTMLDADNGQVVWQMGCKDCYRLLPSGDGRRLFTSSGKRLALWSVDSPDPIWTDTGRVGSIQDGMDTSLDGSRIAWVNGTTAHVHTVGSSTELEATFAESLWDLKFSADGQRLLVASRGEIALWSLQPWKRLWSVRSPYSGLVDVDWSGDDSVLLLDYYSMGTLLLDAATGHHLATVPVANPRAGYPEEKVLPSLKGRVSLGAGRWELWSFPEPDRAPPRESLARITSATGLELVGVELVDTAPGASDH